MSSTDRGGADREPSERPPRARLDGRFDDLSQPRFLRLPSQTWTRAPPRSRYRGPRSPQHRLPRPHTYSDANVVRRNVKKRKEKPEDMNPFFSILLGDFSLLEVKSRPKYISAERQAIPETETTGSGEKAGAIQKSAEESLQGDGEGDSGTSSHVREAHHSEDTQGRGPERSQVQETEQG